MESFDAPLCPLTGPGSRESGEPQDAASGPPGRWPGARTARRRGATGISWRSSGQQVPAQVSDAERDTEKACSQNYAPKCIHQEGSGRGAGDECRGVAKY